ncbi:hypothetical protein LCGC14_1942650 [marine sediment metagenome]|uniref:Uncharacterized protein n=1 Tax=marine sediment metagenome TaxID=412755 RepID=A0A0F9G8E1_9ZZZZ
MGRSRIDLMSKKFGKLYVIGEATPNKQNQSQYLCLCECGKQKVIGAGSLRSGGTQSCGCLRRIPFWEEIKKQQKPIRSEYDEVFDRDLSPSKRKELKKAYDEFWDSLNNPELVHTLKMMLV